MTSAKRALDVVASAAGLLVLLPVLAVIGVAVRRDGGPAFFRQKRIGRGGRPFRMWKFRTMVPNAERLGPQLTATSDRRITPVGRWLRRTKLDELPQLLNVLVGDMSLVGPRPEVARYVALYTPEQRRVLDLVPGITDPASLHYRDEGSLLAAADEPERLYVEQLMPDKIARNLAYAARATLLSDLRVILGTLGLPVGSWRGVGRPADSTAPKAARRSVARQLFALLNRPQRRQAAGLLLLLVLRAAAELIGVASIAPFMSVVADPTVVERNAVLRWMYELGGFATTSAFLTAMGIGVAVAIAVSNGVSALATLATQQFGWQVNHELSLRLLRGYLAQPYSFFVRKNSSALHHALLTEVSSVVVGVLMPALGATAQALVVLAVAGMLVLVDPVLAGTIVCVLGGAYALIYAVVRRRQGRLGRVRVTANELRYRMASEAFGGIKDVKLLQCENSFIDRFAPASWDLSRATASSAAISMVPRYALETVAFGGIVLIVLYHLRSGAQASAILPVISLYALAGYRLLPALQTLFASVTGIRFQASALDDLSDDLARMGSTPLPDRQAGIVRARFERHIRIDGITFSYPEAATPALQDLSLTIRRNETVGLVGSSGSGKTTLVDLLLGLYAPDSGRICIDDVPLDDATIPGWRVAVGYVPQHIFLSDDTIASNIAFGVPAVAVDPELVVRAARMANLHEFVRTLPDGYDTRVGERGVRLSGGQRQRIGIARALYHDPAVLVMDEATSALDGVTEDAVMDAIRDLSGRKTIVLIAHRLSTVRDCDCIYMLDQGRVTAHGTFESLVTGSDSFRAMARLPAHATA